MNVDEPVLVRSARIVCVAGLAAGVLGGVARRLLPRRDQGSSRQERVARSKADVRGGSPGAFRQALIADASAVRKKTNKAAAAAQNEGRKGRQRMRGQGKKTQQQAAAVAASGLTFGEHMKQALREGAVQASVAIQDVLNDAAATSGTMSERIDQATDRARERSDRLRLQADETRKDLRQRAEDGRKDAVRLGKDSRARTGAVVALIEQLAREMVDERVKPSVERASSSANAGASEAKRRMAAEARNLEQRYEEARPRIEQAAGQYSERAAAIGTDLRHRAEERTHDAEHALRESSTQARAMAHEAGESAKRGGKDMTSLLGWSAVAGGLVYMVLLSDEQKRKVRDLAKGAWHEGVGIWRDLRGENADFGDPA